MSQATSTLKRVKRSKYRQFSRIDGDHPVKQAVKNMYVGYDVIHRTDGEVAYFNFELAIEMGLLPQNHSHRLNPALEKEIIHTFSLKIVNEYDILNHTKINPAQIANKQYMATRYLQMQHPNKFGMTSGDGRSIWNGHFKGKNGHWDISSCGTGATRLSPACAIEKRFFRTGTNLVSYGCGLAGYREGLIAAIYSDMMHKNGIPTERTLAIIRYKNGISVNVRAGKNLLRPAHFFGYMKRKDYPALKALMDYCINREIENKKFPVIKNEQKRYPDFLHYIAKNFAQVAAIYESEYIFCWMDWDGDNILFDGGIIDYGTIRQFGLFHHEYRYDDVNRMSTTITEQKNKAKYIVQVFAQIVDYLLTGKDRPVVEFKHTAAVSLFDKIFQQAKLKRLLWKIGLSDEQIEKLVKDEKSLKLCEMFQTRYRFFEKTVSRRKAYKVADGITRDAIFCMRDFLREFPQFYQDNKREMIDSEFIELVASSYASKLDKATFRKKSVQIKNLQKCYLTVLSHVADNGGITEVDLFAQIIERSSIINRYEKMTGNAIINVVNKLVKNRAKMSVAEVQSLIKTLVSEQTIQPHELEVESHTIRKSEQVKKLLKLSNKIMESHRDSI